MFNAERFIELIKAVALDATESTYPVQVVYGTVVSADPLKVKLSQQVTLSGKQLILTESVCEQDYDSDVSGITLTVKAGLKVGEVVLMLRMQGGQKYIILDRVVNG